MTPWAYTGFPMQLPMAPQHTGITAFGHQLRPPPPHSAVTGPGQFHPHPSYPAVALQNPHVGYGGLQFPPPHAALPYVHVGNFGVSSTGATRTPVAPAYNGSIHKKGASDAAAAAPRAHSTRESESLKN